MAKSLFCVIAYDDHADHEHPAMQQVAEWLQNLGLGKYAQSFAENDISFSVLPDLTDQDLKELGVASLGHRRQLLRAIAELKDGASRKTNLTADAVPLAPHDTAERRQVTVMFSDLVGSTAMSTRMDPEDLREVISAYQTAVADTVQRFGGFVAKYMGDGVLIYFGYPQAHEDDAERAVRAGLELVAAVSALKSHAPLQTRVGVATGLVVVGDLIGSGASQEQAIVGETPNLAARLQGTAEPNSVLIAENTRKLLGNLFELEDLGVQDLKGISGPVKAWAAVRPASVESRFDALHETGLTELVGRQEELDLLLRRWSKVKAGEGQVVLLSGEPGIGKSRLTAALLESIAIEPHTRLRYFCSPQHTDSALYPTISQMERAAGFTRDDSTQAKLDKLDALLARSFTTRHDVALLADMLSLTNDGRYPTFELPPQQRRQKTLEALHVQIEALARVNPVLMIFEDAHWSDPTSLELFGRGVNRIAHLPVLLLITFRPEFEPPWIGQAHVTSITLNRLTRRDVEGLIDRVAGNKPLAANVRQDIIERTDGIPLFVEEMAKAVLEAETQKAAEQTVAGIPSAAAAVPATLHASLMARLDRLGPAKEVAQIGSALGREFSHTLLEAVAEKPEAGIRSALDRLIEAGLLFRQGQPPHASYLFKHALVQDAAYGTLLREQRRTLHARIAAVIQHSFAEIAENQPELLARHLTEAGLIEKAALIWGKAGQRSLARSAVVEGAEQLARAIKQIETLPSTRSLRREHVKLQVAITAPLMHLKGFSAPETQAAVERARLLIEQAEALGEPLEDPMLLSLVLWGFWVANFAAFNGAACQEVASRLLSLAEQQTTSAPLILGHNLLGTSLVCTGNPTEGRRHLTEGADLYNQREHFYLAPRIGQDLGISSFAYRAWANWLLGYPDIALADAERAVGDARNLDHAGSLMSALGAAALTCNLRRDHEAAVARSHELIDLADQKGTLFWKVSGRGALGRALSLMGRHSEALPILTTGRATTGTVFAPLYLLTLALTYTALGQHEEAWRCIGEAMTAAEASGETWAHPELQRVAGEIALQSPQPHPAKAQSYFDSALAIARRQQAKSWELRAAMSLARLWRDQGKVQQARELLAPVYGWFTEGFDTRDLKEAKALLVELA
jgi:class 3 adenylate cyclase/predicted ATPase